VDGTLLYRQADTTAELMRMKIGWASQALQAQAASGQHVAATASDNRGSTGKVTKRNVTAAVKIVLHIYLFILFIV